MCTVEGKPHIFGKSNPEISVVVVVQLLRCVQLFVTPRTAAYQASCPSLTPRVCSNSCPLSWWCHPTISSCVTLFSCPQSFPALGSFLKSWLFALGGHCIGASDLASVLPMNIQRCFPLGLTSLISLLSKGPSRVFSSTKVQKHPFSGSQPSLWSNSHISTWLLEKPWLWTRWAGYYDMINPIFCLENPYRQSVASYSPYCCEELDRTEVT